jgi:hypothetical protein
MRNLNFALLLLFALVFFADSWRSTLVPFGLFGLVFVKNHRAFLTYLWVASVIALTIWPIYDAPFRHFVFPSVIGAIAIAHGLSYNAIELCLVRAAVLILMLGLWKLTWNYITKPLFSMVIFSLMLIPLTILTRGVLDRGSLVAIFCISFLGLFSRFFLSALLFRQVRLRQPFDLFQSVIAFPFFQRTIPEWDQMAITRPPDEKVNQATLFNEIALLFAVVGGCVLAKSWFFPFGPSRFWSPFDWGYEPFVNGQGTWAQAWFAFLFMPAFYIGYEIWGRCNMFTLFIRVFGYNIPNSFNEPWKARSFSDFMSRMFHYYSQCITYLFYFPLLERWRASRKIRPIDQLWIAFASIFLFGIIFHVTREYWMVLQTSLTLAKVFWRGMICYSLAASILVCLSFVVERFDVTRRIPFVYRFPVYLFLYAILFTIGNLETDTLSVRWAFLKFLFTGMRNGF